MMIGGYWILFIVLMALSFIIQYRMQSKFEKYSKILNSSNLTGEQIALKMLKDNGISDVQVVCVDGMLTDHYNPLNKTVNLSKDVYYGNSIAAAAVAAHECGHVVQHAKGYWPLKFRSAIVPVVSFSNSIVMWVLLAGMIFIHAFPALIWIGIALFAMTTLFSVITLPVEIDASSRAVAWLENSGLVTYESKPMVVDALKSAAYTYVIAAVSSIATLLYYIAIANGSRR